MATKAVTKLEALAEERNRLAADMQTFQKKLQTDSEKLIAANSERDRLVAKIRDDGADSSILRSVDEQISTINIRIDGYNGRISEIKSRLTDIQAEVLRENQAAAQIAREARFVELKKDGEARALKIRKALRVLISEEIYPFDQIRIELGRQFRDMNGELAAKILRELIFKPTSGMEALRTPELYWRELEDQGWRACGNGTAQQVPGGNLYLTVVSMQPIPKL